MSDTNKNALPRGIKIQVSEADQTEGKLSFHCQGENNRMTESVTNVRAKAS